MTDRNPWLQTYSGQVFDPNDLRPEAFRIEDIAHALGMLCRYCGHVKRFYSIAEHCVIGSRQAASELKMHFLIHDASEAYVSDLVSPIKVLLPEYKVIEKKIELVIYEALEIKPPTAKEQRLVKIIDLGMLSTEQLQLLPPPPQARVWGGEPYDLMLPCWTPEIAAILYLDMFNQLKKGNYD